MKDQSNTQLEGNHLVQKVRVLREKNENVGPKAGTICDKDIDTDYHDSMLVAQKQKLIPVFSVMSKTPAL